MAFKIEMYIVQAPPEKERNDESAFEEKKVTTIYGTNDGTKTRIDERVREITTCEAPDT